MNRFSQIALFVCLLLACTGQAQYSFDKPIRLSEEDGLPSNSTSRIAEDKYGFIWIGTNKGLCRFDGSKILPIIQTEQDSTFFQSEDIRALHAVGDTLLIGTNAGLTILDLQTWHLTNVQLNRKHQEARDDLKDRNMVQEIIADRAGNIWLAPSYEGFVKWDLQSNEFHYYPLQRSAAMPAANILSDHFSLKRIQQDVHQDSIFWGITGGDLVRLNTETGQMRRIRYKHEDSNLDFQFNWHISMYQHTDGKIYMGQWQVGMIIYDPLKDTFSIPKYRLSGLESEAPLMSHGFNIYPKSESELYFTLFEGLYIYDIPDASIKLVKKNVHRGGRLKIHGVEFIDSKGIVWYAVSSGVYYFNPLQQQFSFYSFQDLNPTQTSFLPRGYMTDFFPGYLTFSGQYSDGLYSVNLQTGHTFKITSSKRLNSSADFSSRGLAILSPDELLISAAEGLYYYKKGSAGMVPFEIQPPLKYAYFGNLVIDAQKTAWIGTPKNGLWSIHLKDGEIRSYADQVEARSVSYNFVDRQGNVWFVTGRGHLVYDQKEDRIINFDVEQDSLKTQSIGRNFCQCPNGSIWWGGEENGLSQFSADQPELGRIRALMVQDSSKHYRVSGVACDRNNLLWVLGHEYILKVNPETGNILKKYSHTYGLGSFSYSLFDMLDDGSLLIAGRDGVYVFHPKAFRINEEVPKPYVYQINTNKGSKLSFRDPIDNHSIYLEPEENVLTLQFSAIHYTFSEKTVYQYRMEGVDESWQDPGDNRSITYTNLKGGKYRFLLQAVNNEGIRSIEPYILEIQVGTPWYKATWFIVLGGVLFLSLLYLGYLYRVRQIQKQSQLKADFENQIANIEMTALRAQMNPHFIFNCLNSIELYIIKNDSRKAIDYLNNFSRLVRLILQNSRSDFVNLKDELEALELYIKLEQMRFRYSFDYILEVEAGLNPEDYDIPPMLIQPFIENAIWHGISHKEGPGKVRVRFAEKEAAIACTIEDDGIGREAARRIKESKKVKRKSMGMTITRERIEIINKLYQMNNQVVIQDLYASDGSPAGTKVLIHIPI